MTPLYFLDRGKQRSKKRMTLFNILKFQQIAQRAQELNKEADELFDKVEALEKEQKRRDWQWQSGTLYF